MLISLCSQIALGTIAMPPCTAPWRDFPRLLIFLLKRVTRATDKDLSTRDARDRFSLLRFFLFFFLRPSFSDQSL